jgi:gliding motility-associated-like protein
MSRRLCLCIPLLLTFLFSCPGVIAQISNCNNWLYLPSKSSYVRVGDLDIPGNQITVEALVMRTTPYTGGLLFAGDIVSKHEDVNDNNYLLRPNNAEITTSITGYVRTPDICEIELNKTYHVAMVYDGTALKFYRNGFLMSQVPATGDLIQNNWQTQIGLYFNQVTNEQLIGYVNEVRIWNVARTQAQICQFMETSLPSPTTQAGLLAYYTFDNLLNKQGNATWNGTLGGSAVMNRTNPACAAFVIDSCGRSMGSDFSFTPNICSPYTVQFNAAGSASAGNWSFGDGDIATGVSSPSHTYASAGTYPVSFTTQVGGCPKTTIKQITINVLPDDLILTNDTTICYGTTKQLRTRPALDFCWSPTTYLDNPNSPNPTTSTPTDITYYFNSLVPGNNLIVNGNFSAGNNSFSSGYNFASSNTTEGQYFVGPNPRAWNASLHTCVDHTTGNGNMMLVNGSPTPDVHVWRQTVTVTPNTNYAFSTWIQALWDPNPAQLQFSINGNTIGNTITASLPTCTWKQFYATWNSGNTTTAVISIVNKNTIVQGNDFALDDIAFSPILVKRDSVRITVERPLVRTSNDTTICIGTSAQLNTTGAASYLWSPAAGLSNTSVANPLANPVNSTEYIVTGTTANGCVAKDTVQVSTHPLPTITKTPDTAICLNSPVSLFAAGGVSYTWSPGSSLNNATISNPIATPAGDTKYLVEVLDTYGCSHKDSINVRIRPRPVFTISPSHGVCTGDTTTLFATGGNIYNWSPAASLSDALSASPVATPTTTTEYSVQITESVCNYDTILRVSVTVNARPTVIAERANDITCTLPTSRLTATGATTYQWTPASALDFPGSPNPIASISANTIFTVVGTNQFGCSSSDTVLVKVLTDSKPIFVLPNAFTPNNDGNNDCFGIRHWGSATLLEFSIFNRWGEKIFSTTNPSQCWDGTYKGRNSDIGAYAYVIIARTICGEIKRTGVVTLLR